MLVSPYDFQHHNKGYCWILCTLSWRLIKWIARKVPNFSHPSSLGTMYFRQNIDKSNCIPYHATFQCRNYHDAVSMLSTFPISLSSCSKDHTAWAVGFMRTLCCKSIFLLMNCCILNTIYNRVFTFYIILDKLYFAYCLYVLPTKIQTRILFCLNWHSVHW